MVISIISLVANGFQAFWLVASPVAVQYAEQEYEKIVSMEYLGQRTYDLKLELKLYYLVKFVDRATYWCLGSAQILYHVLEAFSCLLVAAEKTRIRV